MTRVHRGVQASLEAALADRPAVMVIGPRQVGKSTLVESISSGRRAYVTLDDPLELAMAKRTPADFFAAHPRPGTIDEVQRAPELLRTMKLHIDKDRMPGGFLLTGSANVLALPKVSDSLAGRMETLEMLPFSQAEIEGSRTNFIDQLFKDPDGLLNGSYPTPEDASERVFRTGFPEPALHLTAKRRPDWVRSYVKSLLDRDVKDLTNIDGLVQLPELLQRLAARNGTTLNLSSLSREVGIPHSTLTRYVDLLRTLFLVQTIPAWSSEPAAKLTRTPKAFLVDSGLAAQLAHISPVRFEEDKAARETVLQGFVAAELMRLATWSETRVQIFHLRTVRQHEVSFILESDDGKLASVDFSAHQALDADAFEGTRYFRELAGPLFQAGVLLYQGGASRTVGTRIGGISMSALWA
jgi:predicted AAA+ superfamily ATPase